MNGTLVYNESKVKKGVASVIGFSGMPKADPPFTRLVFGRLEKANIRTDNLTFQLSINPNPEIEEEALSDQEAFALATEIMEKMGYGKQPFVVYKHHDIERTHYHVVSCRVDAKGKKINDKFEKRRLEKITKRLENKYHYTLGSPSNKKKTEEQTSLNNRNIETIPTGPIYEPIMEPILDFDGMSSVGSMLPDPEPIYDYSQTEKPEKEEVSTEKTNNIPVRFERNKGKVKQQIKEIFNEALKYRFTTFNQFAAVCEMMGLRVAEYTSKKGVHLSFQGLNENEENVTTPIKETELKMDSHQIMEESVKKYTEEASTIKSSTRPDRARIGRTASYFLGISKSQSHFEKMLQKKGLHACFSFNVNGELFGVTIVDQRTKAAYKASDLLPALRVEDIKERAEIWQTSQEKKEEYEKRHQDYVQKKRDMFLDTIERQLKRDEINELQNIGKEIWRDLTRKPRKYKRKFIKK